MSLYRRIIVKRRLSTEITYLKVIMTEQGKPYINKYMYIITGHTEVSILSDRAKN